MSPVARSKPSMASIAAKPATAVTAKTAIYVPNILQSQPLLVVGAIASNRSKHLLFIKRTASLFAFLSMIHALVASPLTDSLTAKGCFQCFHLLNRRWRLDMPGQCSGTKDDCGMCIEGYHTNSNDEKCQPNGVTTVEKNGIALIPDESTAVIKCEFQENYDCSWSRRDYALDISGRYKFEGGNGLETKICTIIIEPFIISKDYGLWECKSVADSKHVAKHSTAVILTSDRFITVDENENDAYVPIGETVIIKCHFNKTVDCSWQRRTHAVEIKGRYSYLTNDGGISTTDCSIKISPFTKFDIGLWNCESMADSSHATVKATKVVIKQAIMPPVTVAPQNVTAVEGNNVVLSCEFDSEVDCNWQKNGAPVDVDNRYKFTEKIVQNVNTRRNCSLSINPFRKSDVGRWACNYAGNINPNKTANSAWITIQQKPGKPYIYLRNGQYSCSNNLVIPEGSHFLCTSENGNPAPHLRWTLEGFDIPPNATSTYMYGSDDVFNVTISLDYSKHKNQFKIAKNTLKCIATHPAIEEELSTQVDILMVRDQHKISRNLLKSDKKTGSEKQICLEDYISSNDKLTNTSQRNGISKEISGATIVFVSLIYMYVR